MAYGNYFPVSYQPNYFGNQNPYAYQQVQPQQQAQPVQRIQQSGFVLVQSEQEARSYPVAPGNSITFKDETAPFCYVKTMGFNQLDRPIFEKYRLVKEEEAQTASESPQTKDNEAHGKESTYASKNDLDAIWGEIEVLKERIKAQSKSATKIKRVMEADEDEE